MEEAPILEKLDSRTSVLRRIRGDLAQDNACDESRGSRRDELYGPPCGWSLAVAWKCLGKDSRGDTCVLKEADDHPQPTRGNLRYLDFLAVGV